MKRYSLSDTACFVKMRSVNINCLVLGKPFRNIISIKIKENETIGELKRRIKAEKITSKLNEILSYFGIKDIWKENPPKSNIHVVVKIEVVTLN
ncbi:uncharacterized protein OCT59_011630 [Rhizophagus irregularis]|uniref:uncharacterized protein n=1 Tax=Rhizophagus irregularis TaxID=588596 RepID=UPI000CA6E19F|nr:hypothetical protein OCT59_011630 [Rhizophagus irregularis]